ncbi:hypothetical protein ABZ907_47540 [Nonomuraea wenchangensis]
MKKLEGVCERLPDSDVSDRPSPLWTFGERDAAWARAYASALIGYARAATQAVDEAIAFCPPSFTGNITHYELVPALALIKEGDLHDGLTHAVATARAWPMSTIRRRTLGRILHALPVTDQRLEPGREELRGLISGAPSRH